jgi:hypothetical protein
MGNVDVFISSNYLYKNDNNPLIYMGPVWDYDVSSGNVNYAAIVNATVPWAQVQGFWFTQWFSDPGFKADAVTQWNTLMKNGVFTKWLASIGQEAATLEQSQVNNFGRWPMQGIEVWPNAEAAGSYDAEVAYLTKWLALRVAYLDSLFNSKAQTSVTLNVDVPFQSGRRPDRPLPTDFVLTLSAQVSGTANPTGTVSFLSNGVLVGAATLNGNDAVSLTVTSLRGGLNGLQAVYNGDTGNALSTSAVQQVNVESWIPAPKPR